MTGFYELQEILYVKKQIAAQNANAAPAVPMVPVAPAAGESANAGDNGSWKSCRNNWRCG